ncbi:ATP-binding protein [Myxococcus sp. MxC21-1]|uniref:AlbA family DNA-binding domain-containing protein n=1 Tax=Myxococcus sp. MxC21-1 TaxID=3041439 RepID=UPI00292CEDF2|nr:ATP-binding protein [Myxococcus sp. MxC21-1]WNZ60146.1 ATP-binding protein [Myxococcus sp. MxC21-1]
MKTPKTIEDLEQMIEHAIPESDYLDYKDQRALEPINQNPKPLPTGLQRAQNEVISELTRDISAFANSDGGVLIYGVREDEQTHLPIEINPGFPNNGRISKEWLGDIIDSRISPRITGIQIIPIRRNATHSLFVIEIPRSSRAPHQADDGIHYRRYNFSNRRMLNYELREAFQSRRLESPRLISISTTTQSEFIQLTVKNVGPEPARNVSFSVSDSLKPWLKDRKYSLLENGSREIQPGTTYVFHGDVAHSVLSDRSNFPRIFSITTSYLTPISHETISETFSFNMGDLEGAGIVEDGTLKLLRQIRESTRTLQREMSLLRRAVETGANQMIGHRMLHAINTQIKLWRGKWSRST